MWVYGTMVRGKFTLGGDTFLKKHERILKSYKRNHQGENFGDAEKGKIIKEKRQVKKLESKAKVLLNRTLAIYDDSLDDSLMDEVGSITHQSKKVAGNLNAHKTRLVELQKNDDFI